MLCEQEHSLLETRWRFLYDVPCAYVAIMIQTFFEKPKLLFVLCRMPVIFQDHPQE